MSSPDAVTSFAELPARLSSVFRALRNGRHLSRSDGPDFLDLERRTALYDHLLTGLGYALRHHNQGFYYIEGAGAIRSERMRAALLFLLILFQDLEERKFQRQDRAWERSLLRDTFKLAELPHFQTVQRRTLMAAVGIEEEKLPQVLNFLDRLGVLRPLPEGQFGFLPPVYRFVDLCMRYADDQNWAVRDAVSAPAFEAELLPEEEGELES